jgi:hypothetical protein
MGLTSISLPQLGHRLWVQVVSIFIPGFFVSAGLSVLIDPNILGAAGRLKLNTLTSAFWLFFVRGLSYIVGLLARMVGFQVANRVRRPADVPPSDEEVYASARARFGNEAVNLAMRTSMMVDANGALLPGYFTYCKLWLRRHSAAMSMDQHELEINARFALAVPVAVSPLVILRLLASRDEPRLNISVATLLVAVLVGCALSYFLLKRGLSVQAYERQDALNYYVAVWLVYNSPPPANSGPSGPSEISTPSITGTSGIRADNVPTD